MFVIVGNSKNTECTSLGLAFSTFGKIKIGELVKHGNYLNLTCEAIQDPTL